MKILLFCIVIGGIRAQLLSRHGSCSNRCFTPSDYLKSCQCDFDCDTFHNCCDDFWRRCRGDESGLVVTQHELNVFAQSLWDNDVNRIDSALYNLNYQGHANHSTNRDMAANALIMPTDDQLDAILRSSNSTYHSFIQLLDNYVINTHHSERRPMTEIQEENAFWAIASQTQVMQLTFQFLRDNGFIKGDPHAFRTVINEMWFEPYHNQHSSQIYSGFERIMVGEKDHREVHHGHHTTSQNRIIGFTNWIQYYKEEKRGKLDYQGYHRYLQDPPIVDVDFVWHNTTAKGKTFFVGTSPEFDMGLYTVCGLARPNKPCNVTINGQTLTITASDISHKDILTLNAVKLFFDPSQTNP